MTVEKLNKVNELDWGSRRTFSFLKFDIYY